MAKDTDEMATELAAFDSRNERMVVGALGGYLIGGPVGAVVGTAIGHQWE